jgi:asparagine synthase (glutamine-hydrolysing)
MCYVGLRFLIPNFYTYRADRLTMAHSIEARSPFLDFNFVNYAISLDARWKYRQGIPKFILKKSLERTLPREVLYRQKQGFCVPLMAWAADMLVDDIELNLDAFCADTGIFVAAAVREQLAALRQGKTDFVNRLWTIYFLLRWYRRWLA